MKKILWLVIILTIIIIALLGVLLFVPANKNYDVKVFSVKANQEIGSPLVVEGEARGTWFFEASFPIKIIDENGNVLGSSYVQAKTNWMTEDFVEFKGEIIFSTPIARKGFLVLAKDNPSGLPQYDKEVRIPVNLKSASMMTVKTYFNNSKMDPEFSCNKVFAIEREVPKTTAVAKAALDELLKGLIDAEKNAGFSTSIPIGSKLNSISIINGQARADFNATTESGGGSCSMAARVAQITKTLMQFPTITSVRLSVDGRTGDIFQP